jgi:hypothetical protein
MIARSLVLLGVATLVLLVSPVSTLAGRDVRGALVQSLDQQQGCNGDEQILYFPPNPVPNQVVNTQVTSARPSVNVNLVNAPPGNVQPVYRGAGPGGKGTIWYYNITPPFPGRYDYNFFVGSFLCTTNFFITQGGFGPSPTPVPAPPSGGVSWQTSATPVTRLSESNNIQISVRNAAGVPGQQINISIIVAGPLGVGGGPASTRNLTVFGSDLLTVPYPQGFPGAAPLRGGQYHIEWTDRQGNDFASTFVQVVN